MDTMLRTANWLLALILLTPSGILAQNTARLRGVVSDSTGVPLSGITVTIRGTDIEVISDDSGSFRICGLPAATLVVNLEGPGVRPLRQRLTFTASETLLWAPRMARRPVGHDHVPPLIPAVAEIYLAPADIRSIECE
jgi:hypothetical protein